MNVIFESKCRNCRHRYNESERTRKGADFEKSIVKTLPLHPTKLLSNKFQLK